MRKKIVAANWKMNLTAEEGKALVADILKELPTLTESRQVVIAPPFLYLAQTAKQLNGREHIYLGAQNCYSEPSGAYTGEISAPMLKSVAVAYVIIGHSERREYFKEPDAMLAKKINQALDSGLRVIFCCGEPLDIRDADTQNSYVENQIHAGLFHLDAVQLKNIVIAYEPIWAIGTGRTATSAQAQDMHAHIRNVVAEKYGKEAASNTSILYGGSCKPSNAAELFACPDVDGGLIGGASLKAAEFLGIINPMLNS
jgi:triosephosphate isomerase